MSLHTEDSGTASPIFGSKFPFPLDGKSVLYEIAQGFAEEFNNAARRRLGEGRQWADLTVTSAYPTIQQQCPRIAIIRQGSTPRLVGMGGHIETQEVEGNRFHLYKGQMITDQLEVAICTLNEQMRDDLFIWFQQYLLDAIAWILPRLTTVFDITCVNAVDDQAEYQGTAAQPGFQFYLARLSVRVQYELLVIEGTEKLETIVNWQRCGYVNE